jgi:hypothetical protein
MLLSCTYRQENCSSMMLENSPKETQSYNRESNPVILHSKAYNLSTTQPQEQKCLQNTVDMKGREGSHLLTKW